jgi:hypothetical protein
MESVKFDESEIQEKAREISNNEVYANVGTMIEYIISKSYEDSDAPYSYEDLSIYPDPVGEEWDGGQLREAMDEHGIEWGDAMEYGLSLEPLDHMDHVDTFTIDQCAAAFRADYQAMQKRLSAKLGKDYSESPERSKEIQNEWGELLGETGNDLDLIREYIKDNDIVDPVWPTLESLDSFDLDLLREYVRDNIDFPPREFFEYWMVSNWLAGQLQERGEVVIDGDIWARQCTGQSLYMDPPFRDIAIKALSW